MSANNKTGLKTGKKTMQQENSGDSCLFLYEPGNCMEAEDIVNLLEKQIEGSDYAERAAYEQHISDCEFCRNAYSQFAYSYRLSAEVELLEAMAAHLQLMPKYLFPVKQDSGNRVRRVRKSEVASDTSENGTFASNNQDRLDVTTGIQ